MEPRHETIVHALYSAAQRAPDGDALIESTTGDTLSYREYWQQAAKIATVLADRGVTGERIVTVGGNSIALAVVMCACHLARAQLTPLNPRYTDVELAQLIEDAAPRVLIGAEANAQRDRSLASANQAAWFSVEALFEESVSVANEQGTRESRVRIEDEFPAADDLAMLQFTGGTTGVAKGASLTHGAIVSNLYQRLALVPLVEQRERIVCVLPLFHTYAIHMALHNMIMGAGTLVVMSHYDRDAVLREIERQRATLFLGSPTLFADLLSAPRFSDIDFSALKTTYSGSAPLAEALLNEWEQRTGSKVIEGYGQTEAGPVISFNPLHGRTKVGSVGVALPDTEIEIVDVNDRDNTLGVNEAGEIRVRGPQLMRAYRNRPDETAAQLHEGWLYTGDIGELDEDGYLFIRGRKKEMLIVSGFNVYPNEIENALLHEKDVTGAAVIGLEDPRSGEVPIAFVETLPGQSIDLSDLAGRLRLTLAAYKQPRHIQILDQIPRTAVGKIDKPALRRLISGN